MAGTRRGFLKAALTAAGAATTPLYAQAQSGGRTGEARQALPSDPALRVKSLESLLVEKGLVDPKAVDALIETHPDEIHWGHVGTLKHYAGLLRQITDSAFKEGEHAA